jgi:uncharacterized integral membrane protein
MAAALFAVVLLLLLIFILENSQSVSIGYFGAHGHLPLGVALLLAAVLGVLLVALPGTARILQLRVVCRRHRRMEASSRAPASALPGTTVLPTTVPLIQRHPGPGRNKPFRYAGKSGETAVGRAATSARSGSTAVLSRTGRVSRTTMPGSRPGEAGFWAAMPRQAARRHRGAQIACHAVGSDQPGVNQGLRGGQPLRRRMFLLLTRRAPRRRSARARRRGMACGLLNGVFAVQEHCYRELQQLRTKA